MPTSRTGKRGFTLIELLVTLFIMTVMAGIVTVSLGPSLERERLHGGARMVLAALRCARDYAVAHRTDAEVRIGDAAGGVAVYVKDTQATDTPTANAPATDLENWKPLATSAGRQRALPPGVSVVEVVDPEVAESPHDATVSFTALGQGERLCITLQDTRGNCCAIEVDGLTGRSGLVKDEGQP